MTPSQPADIAGKWKAFSLLHFFDCRDPDDLGEEAAFDSLAKAVETGAGLSSALARHGLSPNEMFEHYGGEELASKVIDMADSLERNDSRHSPVAGQLLTALNRVDDVLRQVYAENLQVDDESIGVELDASLAARMKADREGVRPVSAPAAPETSGRKFFETHVVVKVLSEGAPVSSHMSLESLAHEMDQGAFVGVYEVRDVVALDAQTMSDRLSAFGSEPGFFQLDQGDEADDVDDAGRERGRAS